MGNVAENHGHLVNESMGDGLVGHKCHRENADEWGGNS